MTLEEKINIVIVIPTHGRNSLLERTLFSLSQCIFPVNYLKTVVIENGPKQNAEEICRKFHILNCEYQYCERANKSNALNIVINNLDEDAYVIFFDDDIRLSPQSIVAYVNSIQKYGKDFFYGGPFDVDYEKVPSKHYANFLPLSARGWKKENDREVHPTEFFGCNWGVSSQHLKRLGGFDEKFGPNSTTGATGQEHDMMIRLFNEGVKPKYVAEALVWHYVPKERSSISWALRRRYKDGISSGIKNKYKFQAEETKKEIIKEYVILAQSVLSLSRSKAISTLYRLQYLKGVYHSLKKNHE